MKLRLNACWAFLALLASTTAAAAPAKRYDAGQARDILRSPTVLAAQGDLRALVRRGDWTSLNLKVQQWLAATEADPLAGEALLYETAVALREAPPAQDSRALLTMLTRYQARAWVPLLDHSRESAVPAFQIAAAAQGTLKLWQQRETTRQYLAKLAAGERIDPAVDGAALVDALAQAPLQNLSTLAFEDLPAAAQSVLARRLASPAVYRQLVASAAAEQAVLAALRELPTVLARATAVDILFTATENPALASPAMLVLGPLAASDGRIVPFLVANLGRTDIGASSATALAATGDPEALNALRQLLARGQDGPALRHALLGLQQMDSRAARTALTGFAADVRHDPALRREVSAWLR